jgi:NH3-dependent NAD+ synthetase
VPERIITRPPSAELRENQTDQDSLPPYEMLDRILRRYVEARESAEVIERAEPDIPRATIDRVFLMVRRNEYKRRQAAPVLRVTPRAFGEGWRFPVAHGYR